MLKDDRNIGAVPRQTPRTTWMSVSYGGESGIRFSQNVYSSSYFPKNIKEGKYIECKIMGDDCYVNADDIKILDRYSDISAYIINE